MLQPSHGGEALGSSGERAGRHSLDKPPSRWTVLKHAMQLFQKRGERVDATRSHVNDSCSAHGLQECPTEETYEQRAGDVVELESRYPI
jgi:hypothetical protein